MKAGCSPLLHPLRHIYPKHCKPVLFRRAGERGTFQCHHFWGLHPTGICNSVMRISNLLTETAHAAKLQDALGAVQHLQVIHRSEVFAELLVVKAVETSRLTAFAGVESVDGLFSARFSSFNVVGLATEENRCHTDDRIGVVLIQRLELNVPAKRGGDLTATNK